MNSLKLNWSIITIDGKITKQNQKKLWKIGVTPLQKNLFVGCKATGNDGNVNNIIDIFNSSKRKTKANIYKITDKQFGLMSIYYGKLKEAQTPLKNNVNIEDDGRFVSIPMTTMQIQKSIIIC